MKRIVFYSWQSDLPNATNRGFIGTALENVARSIRADDSIEVEPVIDRDTVGVSGSPDIAATILAKIEEADVFVCDISIIGGGRGERPVPNPNVLIELGYAIKKFGLNRIIMVMNTAYGGPEVLPFDLRMKRVITYGLPEKTPDRTPERRKLEGKLKNGISAILTDFEDEEAGASAQSASISEQAVVAVENSEENRTILLRRYFDELVKGLDALAPKTAQEKRDSAITSQAIKRTAPLMQEFARVMDVMAASKQALARRKKTHASKATLESRLNRFVKVQEARGAYRDFPRPAQAVDELRSRAPRSRRAESGP